MINVHDLSSDTITSFDDKTVPEYAVRYCQAQKLNLFSWFIHNSMSKNYSDIESRLPVTYGQKSVACGDFACLIPD